MTRFYLHLWWKWALRITLCSFSIATFFALGVTLFLYFYHGMQVLNVEVLDALQNIFLFWFMILWNGAFLLALFRSLKYIFNTCHGQYTLEIYSCTREKILEVGYGDLVKLWRKWMMSIIWLVGVEMIFMLVFSYFFNLHDWLSVYVIYFFVLFAGYFSFILLISRSKQLRITKC